MFIVDLLTAAAQAAPQNKFGFAEALEQGGFIAYATVVILGVMSFGSFFILFTKFFEQRKILTQYGTLKASFWRASSLKDGASKLEKNSAWRQIVDDGLAAEEAHSKMTDALEAHDWLHGSLARSEASVNARLASGLPFLATVGATSPFIGLFGTVVGIYRALINIGIAGSASIDKVAGPVGEALLATSVSPNCSRASRPTCWRTSTRRVR
jgi:biopolymer transport protein ExbB